MYYKTIVQRFETNIKPITQYLCIQRKGYTLFRIISF
jgi:hypothetical protein